MIFLMTCLILFCQLFVGDFVQAQPQQLPGIVIEPNEPAEKQAILTWVDALEIIGDAKISRSERMKAFQSLLTLDEKNRREGLLKLVANSDSDFAALASQQLVENFPDDSKIASTLIQKKISTWPIHNQFNVLEAMSHQPQKIDDYRAIAVETINRLSDKPREIRDRTPLDIAVAILAHSDKAHDLELVMQTIEKHRQSPWMWKSVVNLQQNNEDIRALAKQVYDDNAVPQSARLLAASLLIDATEDSQEANYIVHTLRGFLSQHEKTDLTSLAEKLRSGDSKALEKYMQFSENLQSLSVLSVLPTKISEPLVFSAMKSKNERIKTIGAILYATRWPQRFLDFEGSFSGDKHTRLLAVLVHSHPGLRDQVERDFPQHKIEPHLKTLKSSGLAGIFPFVGSVISSI